MIKLKKWMTNPCEECTHVLSDETVIYPGHGKKSTIGYEKANNPWVMGAGTRLTLESFSQRSRKKTGKNDACRMTPFRVWY